MVALLLAWTGCASDRAAIEDYCREAYILAQLWTEDMDEEAYEECVLGVEEDLETLEEEDRQQVQACIQCISDTETEECGCCTIDGELEILQSACADDCDSEAFHAFCEL